MKFFFFLILTTSAFAQNELSDLKKKNTKDFFLELQKSIKPGRLSAEKSERLNKMIQEGQYILPPKSNALKAHEEVQLNSIISSGQKDIEQNSKEITQDTDTGYRQFLKKISHPDKVIGPKKMDSYSIETAAAPVIPEAQAPEVKEDIASEKDTHFLESLNAVMASKAGEKSDSQFQIFYNHSETYKTQIIPQLINSMK